MSWPAKCSLPVAGRGSKTLHANIQARHAGSCNKTDTVAGDERFRDEQKTMFAGT